MEHLAKQSLGLRIAKCYSLDKETCHDARLVTSSQSTNVRLVMSRSSSAGLDRTACSAKISTSPSAPSTIVHASMEGAPLFCGNLMRRYCTVVLYQYHLCSVHVEEYLDGQR